MTEVVELVVASDIAVNIFRNYFGKGFVPKVIPDGNDLIATFGGSSYRCGFLKPRLKGEQYNHWVVIESFDDWTPVKEMSRTMVKNE